MNLWSVTMDDLARIEREAEKEGGLSIDQRIQLAQAHALLSISQELSLIQDQGISPEWEQRSS